MSIEPPRFYERGTLPAQPSPLRNEAATWAHVIEFAPDPRYSDHLIPFTDYLDRLRAALSAAAPGVRIRRDLTGGEDEALTKIGIDEEVLVVDRPNFAGQIWVNLWYQRDAGAVDIKVATCDPFGMVIARSKRGDQPVIAEGAEAMAHLIAASIRDAAANLPAQGTYPAPAPASYVIAGTPDGYSRYSQVQDAEAHAHAVITVLENAHSIRAHVDVDLSYDVSRVGVDVAHTATHVDTLQVTPTRSWLRVVADRLNVPPRAPSWDVTLTRAATDATASPEVIARVSLPDAAPAAVAAVVLAHRDQLLPLTPVHITSWPAPNIAAAPARAAAAPEVTAAPSHAPARPALTTPTAVTGWRQGQQVSPSTAPRRASGRQAGARGQSAARDRDEDYRRAAPEPRHHGPHL